MSGRKGISALSALLKERCLNLESPVPVGFAPVQLQLASFLLSVLEDPPPQAERCSENSQWWPSCWLSASVFYVLPYSFSAIERKRTAPVEWLRAAFAAQVFSMTLAVAA